MLPVMCLLYCFQFMDKLSTSYASILGLREDLNMVGDMYSWTATAFYLGYLAFEFPASMLLQRFPVAKTVSVFIIVWELFYVCIRFPIPWVYCFENYFGNVGAECDTCLHYYHLSMV